MNPRQNLIVIKDKDHTDDILRVTQEAQRTVVTYKNGKSYRYARHNVEWLSNPERIPVENSCISVAGDLLSDVTEVLRFKEWVKIFHGSGASRCCLFSDVKVRISSDT